MKAAPAGTHCILELNGCPPELLKDVSFVRNSIKAASAEGMSTLVELASHSFEPHGVTAMGLLAESHVAIHTWPEHGYVAADIFTCGPEADPRRACEYLVKRFSAATHKLVVIERKRG